MKFVLVLCCTLVVILHTTSAKPADDLNSQWEKYKKDFNKKYDTAELDALHKEIFARSVKEVEEHNAKFAKGEVTYTKGINQFSDMTDEEIKKHTGFGHNH
ncbi:hypothetical protein WA026_023248 [Henosepilachna vigintioctopunctata]|uniref:Cathepsin propeptide inhibitor domain-containing protein n=1 Tax=Henosepilachna vigintioctopunctata TaxID=420089 RepID=A0AAW1V3D3_9CUCU